MTRHWSHQKLAQISAGHLLPLAETRFWMLARSDKKRSNHLLALGQADADERWRHYSQLAGEERTVPHEEPVTVPEAPKE